MKNKQGNYSNTPSLKNLTSRKKVLFSYLSSPMESSSDIDDTPVSTESKLLDTTLVNKDPGQIQELNKHTQIEY